MEEQARKRWLVALSWLVALLPTVPPLVVLLHHPPPADAVSLAGSWQRCVEPHCPSTGADADPVTWETVQLPGMVTPPQFTPVRARLRSTVVMPPWFTGKDLLLTLEDTQSGMVRLFFNDHFLGERGLADIKRVMGDGPEGWTVPASYVVPGRNHVELAFTWDEPQRSGIPTPAVLLGPYPSLREYLVTRQNINQLIKDGALVFFAFSFVIVLILLALERDMVDRSMFLWTLGLLLSGGAYVLSKTNLVGNVSVQSGFIFGGILGLAYCSCEWTHHYSVKRVTMFVKINRAVMLLVVVAALSQRWDRWGELYNVVAPYLLVMVAWCIAVSVWSLWRDWSMGRPLVTMAVVSVGGGGLNDLLTDLRILDTPRLFGVTNINLVFVAVAVIIGEFVKISVRNRQLAQSLSVSNKELAVALDQAQEANRLKSEFLARTTHELKTPLNAIVNLPDAIRNSFVARNYARCSGCKALFELEPGETLAKETPCEACRATGTLTVEQKRHYMGDAQETLRYVDVVERSGRRLLRLVGDILDIARIERGTMSIHREDVVVDVVLEDAREALAARATEKNIELKVLNHAPGLHVHVDPTRLTQVIINLVENAIKFSPNGGVVEITCQQQEGCCTWSVRDQGAGIAPEHHALIFDSFRQVHSGPTRKYGGAGLGLAIVKHIVQLHGGTVGVESALGQGSTFTVRMPMDGHTPTSGDKHETGA